MGCPIRITTIGFPPFVTLAGNYTGKDGETRYNVRGYVVEFFLLTAEKMNLTVNFLPPAFGSSLTIYFSELNIVLDGLSDIAIGVIPLAPFSLNPGLVHSIPYIFINVKICVPCPTRVHRMDKIMLMFTLPVWSTLVLVLILTGAVFWCSY
jgi:hypothetical protein